MSANDKVNANRGQPRPNRSPAPAPPPRSSLPTDPLSEQMMQVITEIRGFQREIGAWPVAISQHLAALFREAKEQNAAQQQSEEEGWKKEQAAWEAERIAGTNSLNESAHHLRALAVELQKRHDVQIWGSTQAEWFSFLTGVVLTLGLVGLGAVIHREFWL